jgi:hypothetical protein
MKRASLIWEHPSYSPANKCVSKGKKMTVTFWDQKGVLLVYFLACADTGTAAVCCDSLERLWQARLHQVFIIFQDNSRSYTADDTWDCLLLYELEVMGHPSHSPDFTPFNFHLFVPLKKHLAGKWFAAVAMVKQAVSSWLQGFDTNVF